MDAELKALIDKAQARYDAMTPEEQAAHDLAQRESFVRGMMPAGHDMTTDEIKQRIKEINVQLVDSIPGAAHNELCEERKELVRRLGHDIQP